MMVSLGNMTRPFYPPFYSFVVLSGCRDDLFRILKHIFTVNNYKPGRLARFNES